MWEHGDLSETFSSSPPRPPRRRKFRPGILKRLKPAAQDLISELPDDVLLLIIGKLTLLDSVRASMLSHRWNPICVSRPDLVFDQSNMFLTLHSHALPGGSCDCRQYQGKFVRAVDQVLRSFQGRNLRSFKVSFCLGSNSTDYIDRWISFAIGMGAEELSLGLYCDEMDCLEFRYAVDMKGKYVFQLPNFEGSKANLKSLRLVACLLGQCSPDQFRCLQTLTVVCTNLAQYDLHGMFTCLLTLKSLTFDRCTLPEKLSLSSLTQLENFMIMSSEGVELVEISNMNLVSFQSVGNHCFFPFDLRRAPNLKQLRFPLLSKSLSLISTHLPKHCPALQSLAISALTKMVQPRVLRVANFRKVTELCLIHGEASQFGIVNMNRILRAFPCLQELEFRQAVSPDLEEEKAELKEYVHRRLRRVVMAGFHGTPSEIECVIYLLTHTTVLERLVINPKFSTRHPWHTWVADISLNKEEREKICERLKPFCKDGVLTVH